MKALVFTLCVLLVAGGVTVLLIKSLNPIPIIDSDSSGSSDATPNPRPQARMPLARGSLTDLPVDSTRIVVSKKRRQLKLYSKGKLLRTYRIGLGFSPVDDKVKEGDGATPEGTFYIFTKNPESAYYLSLGISYPNSNAAKRGLRNGLITKEQYQEIVDANRAKVTPPQDTPLGGQIYIHGNGSHKDWTWGCVALDDKDVLELFGAVSEGTKVVIQH